jgi:hypothetical protein
MTTRALIVAAYILSAALLLSGMVWLSILTDWKVATAVFVMIWGYGLQSATDSLRKQLRGEP